MAMNAAVAPELAALTECVRQAAAARTPLVIRAGGSKDFYGNATRGELLDPRAYRGIVNYEPTELVVTARCGTPLAELEAALDAQGQMLAFEPPHFGSSATVGGCIAAGLSGPRRAATVGGGAVRDFVLGTRLLNARGEILSFGGQVMKNVAGYDVSRLLAGSLGTLGIIVEVSLKVVPKPAAEATLRLALDEATMLARVNEWGGQPIPVSATAWSGGVLHLRLSGTHAGVVAAQSRLQRAGGEAIDPAQAARLWRSLREHTEPFFAVNAPLWRLSLPASAEPIALAGEQLIEWGGALRWLRSTLAANVIRARAQRLGGHATRFRGEQHDVFAPLAPPLAEIHKRLKAEFDPDGLFNRGRMYPTF